MGRLTFVVPAVVGGAIGIVLAVRHGNVSTLAVLSLLGMTLALATLPFVMRELLLVQPTAELPPYRRAVDELRTRGLRGPSLAHTRELLLLAGNAYDLHFRFRPLLIDVVSDLLALRTRIDFHEHPEQARSLLGPTLWEVVRPDRPVPKGRFNDPGLDPAALQRVLTDLERITQ